MRELAAERLSIVIRNPPTDDGKHRDWAGQMLSGSEFRFLRFETRFADLVGQLDISQSIPFELLDGESRTTPMKSSTSKQVKTESDKRRRPLSSFASARFDRRADYRSNHFLAVSHRR
jgi:hypothetical protein